MTSPTLESPRSPRSSSPHSRASSATWCQTTSPSRSRRSCTSALPAFDVFVTMNTPAAVTLARVEERLDRLAPEVRVDGDRVGERRSTVARLDVRRRVRARGRADVAALRVRDHEQSRLARVGARVLERAQAVRAERLEERELRLDRDAHRRRRVDQPAAETRDRVAARRRAGGRLALQLDGQEVEHGIEPEHELAAPALDALRQTVGEQRSFWSRPASSLPAYAARAAGVSSSKVRTRSSGGGRRRNCATTSSSSASSGASDGSARRASASPASSSSPPPGRDRPHRRDAPRRDEERAPEAGLRRGSEQAELARAQPLQPLQLRRDAPRPPRCGRAAAPRPRTAAPRRASRACAAGAAAPRAAARARRASSARAASSARRRLFSGPCGVGVRVTTTRSPRTPR